MKSGRVTAGCDGYLTKPIDQQTLTEDRQYLDFGAEVFVPPAEEGEIPSRAEAGGISATDHTGDSRIGVGGSEAHIPAGRSGAEPTVTGQPGPGLR